MDRSKPASIFVVIGSVIRAFMAAGILGRRQLPGVELASVSRTIPLYKEAIFGVGFRNLKRTPGQI